MLQCWMLEMTCVHLSAFVLAVTILSDLPPVRLSKLWPALNLTTSVGPIQIEIHSSLPVVTPNSEDLGHCKELPQLEEDTLQEYFQQALLSDGLQ